MYVTQDQIDAFNAGVESSALLHFAHMWFFGAPVRKIYEEEPVRGKLEMHHVEKYLYFRDKQAIKRFINCGVA